MYSAESNGLIQTSTTTIPDHRTVNETITNGQVRSIKAVATLDTAPPAEVQSGGQLTFTAGNHIHFTDGFVAQPGSDFKAQILPVQSTGSSQASIVSGDIHLKEHHIYGSSRIGIEQKNLLVYDSDGDTPEVVNRGASGVMSLEPVAAVFDYSVHTNQNTTSEWLGQSLPSGLTREDYNTVNIDTHIAVDQAIDLPINTPTSVSTLYSQGIVYDEVPVNQDLSVILNNACLEVSPAPISQPDYDYQIINTCTNIEVNADFLSEGQDGYVEFQTPSLNENENFFLGLKIGNQYYGFSGTTSTSYYIHEGSQFQSAQNQITFDHFGDDFRVTRKGDKLYLESGDLTSPTHAIDILDVGTAPAQLRLFSINNPTDIYPKIFYGIKASREELTSVLVTNELNLQLERTASGTHSIATLTQYQTYNGATTSQSYSQTGAEDVTNDDLEHIGMDVTLSLTADGTASTTTGASLPGNTNNKIGNTEPGVNLGLDFCYMDYNLSNVEGQAQAYNFDTTTSTDTPPPLLSNRQFGPCLFDQDKDGIYDLYEDLDNDQNLSNDDTDFDGIPNYLDPDDDGDGIFTKYEGVSKPTPNKYLNPHNEVGLLQNTNDPTTVNPSNPYRVTNTIPDYLDNDDDGDGYKTWETTEGGPGVASYTIDLTTNPAPVEPFNGAAYTQNTDNNGAVDYLEYTDIVYPEQLPIVQNEYQNTMGDKRYELSNHLGNVLAVITDLKLPSSDLAYFKPDVMAYNDYYPFGMLVDGNKYEGDDYRYGFNGKERDDKVKGRGVQYDYGFRIYDARIGKFLSTDPLTSSYSMLTPYQYASNSPIMFIDLDGLEGVFPSENLSGQGISIKLNNSGSYGKIQEYQLLIMHKNASDFSMTAQLHTYQTNRATMSNGNYLVQFTNKYGLGVATDASLLANTLDPAAGHLGFGYAKLGYSERTEKARKNSVVGVFKSKISERSGDDNRANMFAKTFRHQVYSGLLTSIYGEDLAKQIGDYNEKGNVGYGLFKNPGKFGPGDLLNNAYGRAFYNSFVKENGEIKNIKDFTNYLNYSADKLTNYEGKEFSDLNGLDVNFDSNSEAVKKLYNHYIKLKGSNEKK